MFCYTVTQYYPNFFEGFVSLEHVVMHLRDMLEIPYIKETSLDPEFSHWTIDEGLDWHDQHALIMHFTDGKYFVKCFFKIAELL